MTSTHKVAQIRSNHKKREAWSLVLQCARKDTGSREELGSEELGSRLATCKCASPVSSSGTEPSFRL